MVSNATQTGWESVTNVPCPACGHGIVRWAEAGYVPGWRECDLCEAQFMGDPTTGQLDLRRKPVRKATPKRITQVQKEREEARKAYITLSIRHARESAAKDLKGSYLGPDWHMISAYYTRHPQEDEVRAAYWEIWRAGADKRALAALERLPTDLLLPGQGRVPGRWRPVVGAISRDGTHIQVYREGWGGTYTQSIEDALAGRIVEEKQH